MLEWMTEDFRKRDLDSPRLDAELIVADALSWPRMQLYLELERPLSEAERGAIKERLVRRRAREPMAYILGTRGFYQHDFIVDSAVLIPRPDSETLVEQALAALDGRTAPQVADVCTGSGCVGISVGLAADCHVLLSDVSEDALRVARENVERLGARASTHCGDLFAPLGDRRFDVITINPPYLSDADIKDVSPEIANYEPRLALVAGERGTEFLARIAREAASYLTPDGVLLVELGVGQAPEFMTLLADNGYLTIRSHKDFGGIDRVVEGRLVHVDAHETAPEESHLDLDSSERERRELDA